TYILQQAGDGYTMFGDPEVVDIYDEPDSEFTERYVVEKLGGEIPAEYEGIRGQGRIKFVDQEDPIRSFVTRLYDKCLEREPDAEGLTDWTNKLANKEITAADAVSGFFNSTEMKNLNLSDDEFVERCYQTMLNRKADANGKKYWMDKLAKGMSRDYILKNFVQSNEFGNICAEYGVEKGAIEAPEARDQNEGITEFVARCYDKVLGRKYDVAGLNYWCEKILSQADKKAAAGDAASKGFFTSNEYVAKNASDEDFIKTCYRTFLDREAEAQGLAFWKKEIAKGREHVLKGFASSNEFAKIMARYGIQ
ncbi:MAG: DUF4214 domain-containing protein, partial [Solobacterium sp.]|nr:DUF4214 domain-containing protein [Solobacterium sp.]